jgi:hypothetical protein
MIDLLKKSELCALTGRQRPSGMVRWLSEREWSFEIGADGYPRVDRRYYDKRMMGEIIEEEETPNYGVLRVINGTKN